MNNSRPTLCIRTKRQDKNGKASVTKGIELANLCAGLFPCPVLTCPLLMPPPQPSLLARAAAPAASSELVDVLCCRGTAFPASQRESPCSKACQPLQDKLLRL